MARSPEDVVVVKLVIVLLCIVQISYAQTKEEDELQININTYFDNFKVNVVYPNISYQKNLKNDLSIQTHYLADIVTAASMKSIFKIDGVTSATPNIEGGGDNTPDELRHEVGLGLSKQWGEFSFKINSTFSYEKDYTSLSFFPAASLNFAGRNTTISLSLQHSSDKISPQTRDFTNSKTVYGINFGLTQIFTPRLITQFDFSYQENYGFLQNGYQVVRYIDSNFSKRTVDAVHPESRMRKSFGIRSNYALSRDLFLKGGYRYYFDTWDIKSNTYNLEIAYNFSDQISGNIEYRGYDQTKAYFFEEVYTGGEEFKAVESALNSGFGNEGAVQFTFHGSETSPIIFLTNRNLSLITRLGFYHMRYSSPDWHSGYRNLYAWLYSIGLRIKL